MTFSSEAKLKAFSNADLLIQAAARWLRNEHTVSLFLGGPRLRRLNDGLQQLKIASKRASRSRHQPSAEQTSGPVSVVFDGPFVNFLGPICVRMARLNCSRMSRQRNTHHRDG